jgi:hypothetical protein
MLQENDITEAVGVPIGTIITPIEEILPITVKRLTDDYVKALEKLSGSAVIGVDIRVERECRRDGFHKIIADFITGAETSIRTR